MSLLPHSFFSTEDLPEEDRYAAWREDMSTIFDVEKSPIPSEEPYHASFDLYSFGESVLASLTASSGQYLRTPHKARRDGLDAILLQLFLEGGVQFGTGRRTTYAQAGDIVVFDLAQPVDNINTAFRHITVMWPRILIEEVAPTIARWHGRILPSDSPTTTLLRQHLVSCYQMAPHLDPDRGKRVEEATLSLVGAALAETSSTNEHPSHAGVTATITSQLKRYIREHLGTATLTPDIIAKQFGISRTHLYELLEPVGGIARYQRHLRLQHCLADLQNPAKAHQQISEIAYRWGFSQIATFNRNFRQAYNLTPGEARARALRGDRRITSASPHLSPEKLPQKKHHQWFHRVGI